jgi:hypothetical protein
VAEYKASGSSGAASHHMLVRTTDICRYDSQNDPVISLAARRVYKLGKCDVLNLNFARADINNSTIS